MENCTFADEDVALEVYAVGVGELEHGEQLRLGDARDPVVVELGQNIGVGAPENATRLKLAGVAFPDFEGK